MVVKHRTPSNSYIHTLHGEKYSLPYGDGPLGLSTSDGSIITPRATKSSVPAIVSKIPGLLKTQIRRLLSSLPSLLKILFSAAACYAIYALRTEVSNRERELSKIRIEFGHVQDVLSLNEAKVDGAHKSISRFQDLFANLIPGGQKYNAGGGAKFNEEEMYNKIVLRQESMKYRVHELQDTIADLNYMEAVEHFGQDDFRLKFDLLIDTEIHSFIVEMAPLELMPHSVNFFMEMVKARVWDNSIFTHNANHILLAELKDSQGTDKRNLFQSKGISTLSFPEYSDDYPHDKYTLGFGGRPGGPGFYINTDDNREIHGPGGQSTYELGEEADPCFGKVIEGRHVIDWMKNRAESGDESSMLHTIIHSIRVIK